MKTVNLNSITPNPDNPRVIRDTQYARLLDSIKRDHDFLCKRGIVIADGIILGGNQRYQALIEATRDPDFRASIGTRNEGEVPASWIVDASDWTKEQRRRFVLIDNSPAGISGEWDWDKLANEWDEELLSLCGIEIPELQIEDEEPKSTAQQQGFYKIAIECDDERQMESLLNEFQSRGLKCQSLIY